MPAVRKQIEVADAQMQLLKQEILVYGRQGRVGNHSGQDSRQKQKHARCYVQRRNVFYGT